MAAPFAEYDAFGYIGFAPQTAMNTPVAPQYFVPWKSMNGSPVIKGEVVGDGFNRDATLPFKFSQTWNGDVTTYLLPSASFALLGAILGGLDTPGGSSDPYTHSISTANLPPTPLTIEVGMGFNSSSSYIDVWRVSDCYVSQARITQKGGTAPELYIKYAGINHAPRGNSSVSFESDRPLVIADSTFTPTGLAVTSADGVFTNWVLDIQQAVPEVPRADSVVPLLQPGMRTIDMTFDFAPKNQKLARDIWTGTDTGTTISAFLAGITSFEVKWDLGGSPDHYLDVVVNNLKVLDGKPNFSRDGNVFQMMGVKARATLVGSTQPLVWTAQNSKQGAYFS